MNTTMNTMTLTQPVTRGETTINQLSLRKPDVGTLRGLKMTDILQMDVNAMMVLLPRITEPALLPAEVSLMDPADFVELAGRAVSFFASPSQRAQIEAMGAPL